MRLSLFPCALFLVTTSLVACSSTESEEADSSDGALSSPQIILEAKLRDQPHMTPDANCDFYTLARLGKKASGTSVLQLEDKLDGDCEMPMPAPNKRSYTVKVSTDTACGTNVYAGKASSDKVTFTDSRVSHCESFFEDFFVLEEYRQGRMNVLYGSPNASAPDASAPTTPAASE